MNRESQSLKITYNNDEIDFPISEDLNIKIYEPNNVIAASEEIQLISEALSKPSGSESFDNFLKQKGKLLVIVNDGTRPTPTRTVIKVLDEFLENQDVTFIIATGVHRAPTEEEYRYIFGSSYDKYSDRIVVHDSRKSEDMIFLGTSNNGTEMWINKHAIEADKILVIGSVEPHYFAGYTGGRKALLPGIASFKTIEQNHKHALDKKAQSLSLKGNPVHEDMIDAIKVVNKNIFTIMTVLDKEHKVYAATSGDIHSAFNEATKYADDVFVVDVEEEADIVISIAKYPMDFDLYQSQKALDNGKLALKEGGILILISAYRNGVGEDEFIKLLSSCRNPQEVLEKIKNNYKLGWHKAGKMAEINLSAEVWAVTELEEELLKSIFITPFKDIKSALNKAVSIKGKNAKILILPDGCVTVLRVKKMIKLNC